MIEEEFKVMQKADKYAWKDMKAFMDVVNSYYTGDDDKEEFIGRQLINAYMEGYKQAKSEMEVEK